MWPISYFQWITALRGKGWKSEEHFEKRRLARYKVVPVEVVKRDSDSSYILKDQEDFADYFGGSGEERRVRHDSKGFSLKTRKTKLIFHEVRKTQIEEVMGDSQTKTSTWTMY